MEFEIGDKVRVRPWADLVKEYGVGPEGIKVPTWFYTKAIDKDLADNILVITCEDTDETVSVTPDGTDFADSHWVPACVLTKAAPGTGTADSQEHYKKSAMQPIEVAQTFLSTEQFKGFLLGNVIKYRMRSDYKGQHDSDLGKAKQYAYWYSLVKNDASRRIKPVEDLPPADFRMEGIVG